MNNWKLFIIIYLVFSVIFNYSYKFSAKCMNKSSTLTILVQIISSLFCLIFIPIFKIKYPTDIKVYIFLFLAIIFYTLNDRFGTISRSKIDASIYTIIKQLSTVFMILFGIIFLKEKILINKIIGSSLIILSNIFILYKKEKLNKYISLGILANICLAFALIIDVNYSSYFNLAFYVLIIMIVPAILIFIFERIKINDIILEYKASNKLSLYLTSFSWVIMMISKLKAYNFGIVSVVAPISSLSVILTIIVGYLFFNEKNNLIKKIIAGVFILIGIIFIKL